jgi:peroxiredoxin Q/BCP
MLITKSVGAMVLSALFAASASAIDVGQPCPVLTGVDQAGDTENLQDYLGTKYVVLVFYPRDFTPLSDELAEQLAREYMNFSSRNTIVFGVCNEHPQMHAAFADYYKVPCTLIADEGDAWRRAFGVEGHADSICSFVVDMSGKVAAVLADATEPREHVRQLAAAIKDLGADRFSFKVGRLAPNVVLPLFRGKEGEKFDLRSLRGRPVVIWFLCGPPGFTCSQCRELLADLEKRYAQFQERGVDVVVISRDGDVPGSTISTAIRHDNLKLPFIVLIDDKQEAAWAFGAITAGRSRTTLAILDVGGVVRFLQRVVNYKHPGVDIALQAIDNIRPPLDTALPIPEKK